MKKPYLFILILVVSIGNLFAQQGPRIGYDQLDWGATIEVFQRAYPTAREVTSEKRSIGVREFEQTNVGSGITSRRFIFFNNRFYSASVIYEDLNSNSALALMERIVEIYGRFDNRDEKTFPSDNTTVHMTRLIRNYRNNFTLVFTLNDIYNQFNRIIGNMVVIGYYNPVTQEEVDVAERRQRGSQLGL